jgi:hypothetical protein
MSDTHRYTSRYGETLEIDGEALRALSTLASGSPPELGISTSSLVNDAITSYVAQNAANLAAVVKAANEAEAEAAKAAEVAILEAKVSGVSGATPAQAEAAEAHLEELQA